jgi:hypothetical protein
MMMKIIIIQLLFLHANLTAQRPIAKLARVKKRNKKQKLIYIIIIIIIIISLTQIRVVIGK